MKNYQEDIAMAYEVRELSSFTEVELVSDMISKAVDNPSNVDSLYSSFSCTVQRYQEQPELLDPYLEGMLSPLTLCLKQVGEDNDLEAGHRNAMRIARLLQCITSVRGHKHVVKYYPVEVESFDPVLKLLKRFMASGIKEDGGWEAQCQLMLWLSALSQIPFDLSLLDPPDAEDGKGVVQELLEICEDMLSKAGTVRDFGCILLYKVLSRADQNTALQKFLEDSHVILSRINSSQEGDIFLSIGMAQSAGWLFKHCRREVLLPIASEFWSAARELVKSKAVQGNALLRKLAIKLCQRVGLTWLAPRTLRWRYVKKTMQVSVDLQPGSGNETPGDASCTADDEDMWDIPEELEEVFEVLLKFIKDKDTFVRWSAAKGIGRICSRLPKDLVQDVLASVLEIFSPVEVDSGWHGACLTVAELARRGLLLPESIPTIVPLVESALLFDVSKGSYSIGANVRDAAAYVCWACARSYDPHILAPYMESLGRVLMVVACTDREVNCRRAASAAFQECVGRIANVPHGIEILNTADYFALSTLSQAYLDVTPSIAKFPHYRQPIIHQLLHVKLRHWDTRVRELAGNTLRKLVVLEPDFFATDALTFALEWCFNDVLDIRHGAGMGLGAILRGLSENNVELGADLRKRVGNVVMDIEKARLYRGKGGEKMREAVCKLIASIAEAGHSGPPRRRQRLMVSVNENLRHPKEEIQAEAVLALYSLARQCTASEVDDWLPTTIEKFMAELPSENVAIRRGYTQGLGALPRALLAPRSAEVLDSLAKALEVEEDPEDRDAEARVGAVKAFNSVLLEVMCGSGASPCIEDLRMIRDKHFEVIFLSMEDYNTDYRGDVGSWVRCGAMKALQSLTIALAQEANKLDASDFIPESLVVQVVGYLMRNCVERISRVRETAAENLKVLLGAPCVNVPHGKRLLEIVGCEDGVVQFGTGDGIPKMLEFLASQQYQFAVLEGLIASLGGLDKSLSHCVTDALVGHVSNLVADQSEDGRVEQFLNVCLEIWQKHSRSPRMATPVLKTVYQALKSGGLICALSTEQMLRILERVKSEVTKCQDIARLISAASVTSALALTSSPKEGLKAAHQPQAWKVIAVLLGNRYPRVRKGVAEALYEEMLFLTNDEVTEEIMSLLLSTIWDGSIQKAVDARNTLCGKVGIQPIVRKPASRQTVAQSDKTDENSYQSFITDFARGM